MPGEAQGLTTATAGEWAPAKPPNHCLRTVQTGACSGILRFALNVDLSQGLKWQRYS
jgi:hypothetical protein